ncbi:MAG: SPOR domain-containing protein [Alphaproteobacteria bacterium]|nr:SPOR domain-containing protein [Alphaproteobacteria bacterium]
MLDDFQDDDLNNSGEFLDEFRQRLNSQPLDNIDERRNQINRSQQIFISTILGIGLAGAVSWFIFSADYNQNPNVEIPVVRRAQTAVKMQPADPGGMEILNQDKTVYDIVEKAEDKQKVESLLPPPEEPEALVLEEQAQAGEDVAQEAQKIIAAQEEVAAQTEALKEDAAVLLPPADEIKKPVLKEEIQIAEEKPVKEIIEVKKAEAVSESKPLPTAPQATKTAENIPNGVWQLQLMSTPNEAAIAKGWAGMKAKYPALTKLPYETEAADLGAKGVFYRLKAGAFVDRGEADKLCNSIKNAGGTCLVKKK